MTFPPFIVVGPGRCGTSAMAKRLIDAGVFMGHDFVPADQSCPNGFYEDQEVVTLNQARLAGALAPDEWCGRLSLVASARRDVMKPWGWKDPRTCEFIEDVVRMFPGAVFIRCRRPRERIIASHRRWYGWERTPAEKFVDGRERLLDLYLPEPYCEVWIEQEFK